MAIQTSGIITLSDIQTEFGGSNPVSLSEYYAGGSYVPSGTSGTNGAVPASGGISLSDFYGTSALFAFNITTNATNANLRTLAVAAGWNGSSAVACTINSGVIISGNTAGNSTAAMTIDGSFPAGVTLVNNGQIRGRGGDGADGVVNSTGSTGGRGGRALTATVAASIDNQGNIWAGGGGGGSGGTNKDIRSGGGGGGRSSNVNSSGGIGPGNSAGNGTLSAAGSGSGGGDLAGNGGNGGDVGAAGAAGTNYAGTSGGAGGAGGQAVNGNSNITWINTGSRLGAIA
jgi:hypothetical protein